MKLQQALEILSRFAEYDTRDSSLFVEVTPQDHVGGTPCVPVRAMDLGFDWDAGRVLIRTVGALTDLSRAEIAAIRASVRQEQSWHTLQLLKAQKERYERKIAELERQLVEARGAEWKSRASDSAMHG